MKEIFEAAKKHGFLAVVAAFFVVTRFYMQRGNQRALCEMQEQLMSIIQANTEAMTKTADALEDLRDELHRKP